MRTHYCTGGAKQQGRRRDMFDRDFDRAGQPMLQRDRRACGRVDRQLHANFSIADFSGDPGDFRRDGSVLRPWESLQAHGSALSRVDLAERSRGLELRDDLHLARGQDDSKLLPFGNLRPRMYRRAFAQAAGDRSADAAAIDFVFQALDRG
jgi:hypothetical protein